MGALALALPGPSWLYRAIAIFLLFVGVLTYGYVKGISHEQARAVEAQARSLILAAKTTKAQNVENVDSAQRIDVKLSELEDRYKKLQKGLKGHVTKTDSACTLSTGWVLLHDAAAGGALPGPPTIAEADPSGITAVEALEKAVLPNYHEYDKCREQVIEFNRWYVNQKLIYENAAP